MSTHSYIPGMQTSDTSTVQQNLTQHQQQQQLQSIAPPNQSSQHSQTSASSSVVHSVVTLSQGQSQLPHESSASSAVTVAKVLVPAQLAVVSHSPVHQQSHQEQQPQTSALFQALTSSNTPHLIAVAVPGQENQRQGSLTLQPTQTLPYLHYLDGGGGGSNLYSATNGHIVTESPLYSPSANYYNSNGGSSLTYTQVENVNQGSLSVQNQSVSRQEDESLLLKGSSESLQSEDHTILHNTTRTSAATIQWLVDNYETAEGVSLPRSTMYSHYLKHCTENKLEPVNAASFGKLIRSVFLGLRTRRLGTRGNSKYHYYGIRVKSDSYLNHTIEESGSTAHRQFPYTHVRRVKTEHPVKPDGGCDFINSCDTTETGKSAICPQQAPQKHQHHMYLGDASDAIPNIAIQIGNCVLPNGLVEEDLHTFRTHYRRHFEEFLDAVVNLQFNIVESLWLAFWQSDSNSQKNCKGKEISKLKLQLLCKYNPVQQFIKEADYIFYQNLVDVLIPEVLRPIPSSLTQAIRNFAKNLEGWLTSSLTGCCEELINIKVSAVSAFAQTLRRYTSLNHLAQAARAVLQSSTQVSQMMTDLNRVDFRNIQEQASWICQCEDHMVQWLLGDFIETLQHKMWLEQWASWLERVVSVALKAHEGHADYPKAARQFLLKWSFYSSLVIRDLTLRSAASFGSFHLIRLLYDEYMFYIIEHCVAKATGVTPIAVMGEYICLNKSKHPKGNDFFGKCGSEASKSIIENMAADNLVCSAMPQSSSCLDSSNIVSENNELKTVAKSVQPQMVTVTEDGVMCSANKKQKVA